MISRKDGDECMEIVIATHGELASGLASACSMICGRDSLQGIHVVILKDDGKGITEFEEQVHLLAVKLQGEPVLILTDLFGATPANVCLREFQQKQHRIISGSSLPCLLEAVLNKSAKDVNELAEQVLQAGMDGLRRFYFEGNQGGEEEDIFV